MEIKKEKEYSLYPMLPTESVQPTCISMVHLLEEKSKRLGNEWAGTLGQLEKKKTEAEQLRISSGNLIIF